MPRRVRQDSPLSRGQIAWLHMEPVRLGIDNDLRKLIQQEETGKESCKDMTYADFLKLRRHYTRIAAGQGKKTTAAGASPELRALYHKVGRTCAKRPDLASFPQFQKILRMMQFPKGADTAHLEKTLDKALMSYVGVRHWHWLDPEHAHNMIEALKAKARKRA